MLGAHTIGQIRVEFGDELAGPWVPGGKDDATEGGPVFDNEVSLLLLLCIDVCLNCILIDCVCNF